MWNVSAQEYLKGRKGENIEEWGGSTTPSQWCVPVFRCFSKTCDSPFIPLPVAPANLISSSNGRHTWTYTILPLVFLKSVHIYHILKKLFFSFPFSTGNLITLPQLYSIKVPALRLNNFQQPCFIWPSGLLMSEPSTRFRNTGQVLEPHNWNHLDPTLTVTAVLPSFRPGGKAGCRWA